MPKTNSAVKTVENYIKCFPLLVSRLSKEEIKCLSHCLVFSDCAIDGSCEIQKKVNNILKE